MGPRAVVVVEQLERKAVGGSTADKSAGCTGTAAKDPK